MTSLGRIAVAMSGGVDSSVAAGLLLEAGHEVIGATLRLRPCREARESRSCCGFEGVTRARAVAGHLGIPHYIIECTEAFEHQVLRPAWGEYARGRTPSPCLPCNERIKFGRLLDWTRQIGIPQVATGHYAQIGVDADGSPTLLRGADAAKDQAYFLAGLDATSLSVALFPIGRLSKLEVRAHARRLGLPTAESPESQDACFVDLGPDALPFAEMLRCRFEAESQAGAIVDTAGRAVGEHRGVHLFTVGQRRGLGLRTAKRYWVASIDAGTATVVVTDEVREIDRRRFVARDTTWIDGRALAGPRPCRVQVRSQHAGVDATVAPLGVEPGAVAVECAEPVRAITPGQAAVFFDGPRVLGRGWIHAVE
jgi:tRNA-uridine 2-sulfurtransferase